MTKMLRFFTAAGLAALLLSGLSAQAQAPLAAATNKLSDGGFETGVPSYWTPSGAGATWASDRWRTAERSLQLGGAGEASWVLSEAILNWVPRFPANTDLEFGAWVWTDGVNTSPGSDDQKYQLVYTFRDAGGNDLLGGPLVLDLPQGSASSGGWVEVTSATLGPVIFSAEATSATITLRKGANTTGTVWADDFFVRTTSPTEWPGDIHNANVDVPGGWYYYWDNFPRGGDWPATQPFAVTQTSSEAHSGAQSLRIEQLDPAATEAVGISERVPVTAGQPVLVSYWLKTVGNQDPGTIGTGDNNVGLTVLWYNQLESGAAGYGEIGGADIRLNGEYNSQVIPLLPRQADNGWTQYAFVLYPLPGAVGVEARVRYWHAFTGQTYWDDVFIGDVPTVISELPNLLAESGFETTTAPSYFTPAGAATWATDRAHSGERSLRLGGSGEGSWTMPEAVLNWVPRFPGSTDLTFGAWVWTEGVNTGPTTDDQKYQLVYTFRDASGNDLLGGPLVLDLPQATASTGGWVEVSTASLGPVVFAADATSATIVLRKGANATGQVWVDDLFVRTTSTTWPGDIHGANVDLPGGWYLYWDGFSAGLSTPPPFAVTQTSTQAHTGAQSVRIERTDPAATSEAVAISPRVPVTVGQPVLLSYWVKNEGNTSPETIGTGDNNIGLTALWYSSLQSGAAGYNEIGGADIRLNGEYNSQVIPLLPRQADNGWTQYAFVLNPIANAVGLEMRLRYWHAFTGVTYWDDVAITNVGADALGTAMDEPLDPTRPGSERWLMANTPNPFGAATEIRFALPQATDVTLEVYDLLGRRVALLVDGQRMAAEEHTVTFSGEGLTTGRYLVVLRTPAHSEARTITVVR